MGDFISGLCTRCEEIFYDEDAWRAHLAEKHGITDPDVAVPPEQRDSE